jgi:hypothetical protein
MVHEAIVAAHPAETDDAAQMFEAQRQALTVNCCDALHNYLAVIVELAAMRAKLIHPRDASSLDMLETRMLEALRLNGNRPLVVESDNDSAAEQAE